MNLRRLVSLSLLIALSVSAAFAIETAEQVLEKCRQKIVSSPSVTFKFNLKAGSTDSKCELIVEREKYRLTSPEIEVWYNGETQWSYSKSDRELSITDPTDDELLESNPFAIINNYKKAYKYRRLESNSNDIELTATNPMSTIRKAVITIDKTTFMPSKLIVTLSNGRTFTVNVEVASVGKALPASTFTYNKQAYPATTIIDLR